MRWCYSQKLKSQGFATRIPFCSVFADVREQQHLVFTVQGWLLLLLIEQEQLKAQCVAFTGIYWHKAE